MTETIDLNDPTRATIVERLEKKRGATTALGLKKTNLTNQISTYQNSISKYEEKITKLSGMIDTYSVSLADATEELERRSAETEHIAEILERYDVAKAEQLECLAVMRRRLDEVPEWYPGMDESLKGGVSKDPEYTGARDRKDYLDMVMETALADVNRIYFSRGEVSTMNSKETNV